MKCFWSLPFGVIIISSLAQFSQESKAPLFFEKEPNNVIAVTGKSATFHCKAVAAGKKITYFWKLNGYFINEDDDNGFRILNGMLQIFNVTHAKHTGAYECVAFNKDLGSIRSITAKLEIAYIYRERLIKLRKISFDLERPTMMQAPTYRASPAPTFKWQYQLDRNDYVNSSCDKELYVTSKGNLLIPSTVERHQISAKVLVSHPAMAVVDTAIVDLFWLSEQPKDCENSNLTTFPTVTNKTAYEGSDVFFECLAVAVRCYLYDLKLKWVKKATTETFLNETSRKLILKNVTKKSHEGIYECQASINPRRNTLNITYTLNVIEKPKIVKAVKLKIDLPSNGILYPAVVKNTKSLSWYKDGDIIDSKSSLFEILPNGNMRIKYPSPVFSGIYQTFFENQAGVAVFSQTVDVDSKDGCGWRIVTSSGSISYTHSRLSWRDTKCVWYFQLPSTQLMQIRIKQISFNDKVTFSVYEGSSAPNSKHAMYYLDVAYARGPFISVVLDIKAQSLGKLIVDYWPKSEGPPTTISMSSSTIKPTKEKPVKAKQKGGTGSSMAGAIAGAIIGALVLIALILLVIYREKIFRKCGYSRSANVTTEETTSTPMIEVNTSKQAC